MSIRIADDQVYLSLVRHEYYIYRSRLPIYIKRVGVGVDVGGSGVWVGLDTLGRRFTFIDKENNFCDFLFAFRTSSPF